MTENITTQVSGSAKPVERVVESKPVVKPRPSKEQEIRHPPFKTRVELALYELKTGRTRDALREIAGTQGQRLEDEIDRLHTEKRRMIEEGEAVRDDTRQKFREVEDQLQALHNRKEERKGKIRGYASPAAELFDE